MVITLAPWLFHLLLSIIVLILAFIIGRGLNAALKKRESSSKAAERWMAAGLAIVMGAFYFYTTDIYTDRASYGERVITEKGNEIIDSEQEILIPFGTYVVIERLYEFGYIVKDTIQDDEYRISFFIEDETAFLKEHSSYIKGNHLFSNHARFNFNQAYEKEWEQAVKRAENPKHAAVPGMDIQLEKVK